jgi:ABC-type multidrug transport system ATPase subunit
VQISSQPAGHYVAGSSQAAGYYAAASSADCVLSLAEIGMRRGEWLFNNVSFALRAGEGLGVCGHNGCGKTTLLDIIAQMQKPALGSVKSFGRIGYCMQRAGFLESLSFRDNLLVEAHLCGLAGKNAKREAELAAARCDVLPYWNKRYSKGSSGMKGRLNVASAILASPQILLLDEAFNFLDEQSLVHLRLVLTGEKQRGAALVMVSHDRDDFFGLCERVLHLPDGQIESLQ